MALFLTFEGGEGCGKSTQAKALYSRLTELAIPVLLTHEPGGTPFGQRISRWLKWSPKTDMSPLSELMLFNASRAQLVAKVIMPALEEGEAVICDRYTDSTIAYQSYGRGIDLGVVKAVNNAATSGLTPALTILLDIPVKEGLTRRKDRRPDRFEKESLAFHEKVRKGYLELANKEPKRWLVIDATQNKGKVAGIIWQRVSRLISKQDK